MDIEKKEGERMDYKYRPEDFEGYSFLPEDMKDFYEKLEAWKKNPCEEAKSVLTDALHTLHFSIKHRTVEGYLTEGEREQMWDYFWGLV